MEIPITAHIYEMKNQAITKIIYEDTIFSVETQNLPKPTKPVDSILNNHNQTIENKKPIPPKILRAQQIKRGKILAYFNNVAIYEKPYTVLKEKGDFTIPTIKKVLTEYLDCAQSTIKSYSSSYKRFLEDEDDPRCKRYEHISEKNKQEVLEAISKTTEDPTIDNILLETHLTPIHVKTTLQELLNESKIIKDGNQFRLNNQHE